MSDHVLLDPAADFELMIRQHALRAIRDDLDDAARRLVHDADAVEWTGAAADSFRSLIRTRGAMLRSAARELDSAVDTVASWRWAR